MNEKLTFKDVVDDIRESMKVFESPECSLTFNYADFDVTVIVKNKTIV